MTSNLKQSILEKLLPEAGFSGWTETALEKAAQTAGYAPTYGRIAFPSGMAEAADYYINQVDDDMLEALKKLNLSGMKIRERITAGVWARLELYTPHKEAVRTLVSWFALPAHAPSAARHLAHTCDSIWHAAGDNATDYNWYTKRFLLAGVYSSTLLYWLNDTSENHAETRAFLNRRIENVMQIQKTKGKIAEKFSGLFARAG